MPFCDICKEYSEKEDTYQVQKLSLDGVLNICGACWRKGFQKKWLDVSKC